MGQCCSRRGSGDKEEPVQLVGVGDVVLGDSAEQEDAVVATHFQGARPRCVHEQEVLCVCAGPTPTSVWSASADKVG